MQGECKEGKGALAQGTPHAIVPLLCPKINLVHPTGKTRKKEYIEDRCKYSMI